MNSSRERNKENWREQKSRPGRERGGRGADRKGVR